MKFSGTTL
jgi:hypothetical protein